jgi:hypothetical protein
MTTAAERKYEELARRMTELKEQMLALATEVHQDRAPGKKDDDARDHVSSMANLVGVKKAAVLVRQDAEAQLDALAKSMQSPGETFAKAYTKALDTPAGRSLTATLDDATRLSVGQPTEVMIDAHRRSLTGAQPIAHSISMGY